ncbi:class I SAM-dependent methyltransferase [Methylococcus sp. EFPC2]|uniref:class I SAM-dependent methyltransferase n=1 Tax=Methylococcus sp. EFPC2 TaxID=2812648 RepID=UPI001967E5A8|nr:class I SAM-dependent methyltransferase [Methylococcus sp. EFPC2]QSA97197.1 class I SAM-dependent methyltransferase [Methylococcus sp. EFPC2]
MSLNTLLDKKPLLHRGREGKAVSWAISEGLMKFLDETTLPGWKTIEIGCGYSTIILIAKGAQHICIVPDKEQTERIVEFCRENEISTADARFEIDFSETILPKLQLDNLDLILIDGRHGFPAPFIDWYYTVGALKIGGILIVDDTHIWTGKILHDFLVEDPNWRLVREIDGKTSVFTKLGEGSHQAEWLSQPYVKKHSQHQPEADARRALRAYYIRRAKELIKSGDIIGLISKVVKSGIGLIKPAK